MAEGRDDCFGVGGFGSERRFCQFDRVDQVVEVLDELLTVAGRELGWLAGGDCLLV